MLGLLALGKQYLNLIVGAAAVGAALYASSVYYNHKLDKLGAEFTEYQVQTEKNIADQKVSVLQQTNKLAKERDELNIKLAEMSNESFKKHSALERENARIRASIGAGVSGLRVSAICPKPASGSGPEAKDSSAAGVDDGAPVKVLIDPKAGGEIVELTNEGDKYKTQLEALQEWVNALVNENNK